MSDTTPDDDRKRADQLPPSDPLRRDFVFECLNHVAHTADTAAHAIAVGADELFEVQIDLMRLTMREVVKTFREIKEAR